MRLACFWILQILHKIAKKQTHDDLNQLEFSNSLAYFEKNNKNLWQKTCTFCCLKNANNCSLSVFYFSKPSLICMRTQNNCLKNCSSVEPARFTAFKKHILPILEKSFQKPRNILHKFTSFIGFLHCFCVFLKTQQHNENNVLVKLKIFDES